MYETMNLKYLPSTVTQVTLHFTILIQCMFGGRGRRFLSPKHGELYFYTYDGKSL